MSDITGGVDLMALVKGKGMAEPTADESGFMGDAALDALAQGSWLAHLQPLPAPAGRKVAGARCRAAQRWDLADASSHDSGRARF